MFWKIKKYIEYVDYWTCDSRPVTGGGGGSSGFGGSKQPKVRLGKKKEGDAGTGTPRPPSRSVTSLPRRLLSEAWKYRSFPELIIIMNVSETACLTLDIIVLPYPPPPPHPLLYGGNHIFAPNMHRKLFFGLQMQNFHRHGRGTSPPPARLLRSLADYFRRHGNIGHFQRRSLARFSRSLIIMMNVYWNSMLNVVASAG